MSPQSISLELYHMCKALDAPRQISSRPIILLSEESVFLNKARNLCYRAFCFVLRQVAASPFPLTAKRVIATFQTNSGAFFCFMRFHSHQRYHGVATMISTRNFPQFLHFFLQFVISFNTHQRVPAHWTKCVVIVVATSLENLGEAQTTEATGAVSTRRRRFQKFVTYSTSEAFHILGRLVGTNILISVCYYQRLELW